MPELIELKPTSFGGYSVHYENGVFLGYFYVEVDGYLVFQPEHRGGYWDSHVLIAIGKKLEELNKPWDEKVNADLSQIAAGGDQSVSGNPRS